jgi:GPH family glycoside/pentoside/hexuronide:cation symporter
MSGARRRLALAYGAPAFALALFGVPVFVHLPKFYADVLGAPLGALSAAILLTRSWDAVLDPVIGALSDRTRTRWGRRRPYLMAAPLPLAVGVLALFAPPVTGGASVVWFGAAMTVGFAAWAAVQIPHAALGPELEEGHHARTSLFAVRDGLWIAGTLAAAVAPMAARALWAGPDGPADERRVFATIGALYAVLLVALPWWCAAVVRERPLPAPRPATPVAEVLRDAWANRPFRVLLVAYAVGALGGALPGTLLLFYVEHVLGAPEWADFYLGLYFLVGFAGLPGWLALARRVGKKRAFIAATALSVTVFSAALPLGRGDTTAFLVVVVLSGLGFGAGLVLPASMQADTIDYDELRTGQRREGQYLGLWAVVMKASAALGAGLGLAVLDGAGYAPGGPQPAAVVTALKVLYCGLPCLCYVAALLVAARYPLDEGAHARVQAGIAARRRGESVRDPIDGTELQPGY